MGSLSLTRLGALAGALMAVLLLAEEGSLAVDSIVFTEAEAGDLATQSKIASLTMNIEVLKLKRTHAKTPQETAQLTAEISYYQSQLRYLQCLNDPRMKPDQCVKG